MPDNHEFITTVNKLLSKLDETGDLATGLEIANSIIKLLGTSELESVNNIIDEHVMHLPNAERYDHWFQNHPWMGGERAAFEVLDGKEIPIQGKFYWLKKRSRQFIAGGVHFTENWEDAPYTRNENFKIGIDFFLAPNGKSLLVTLSNRGNLRIVELQQKLNNTQVDIFTKWRDATQISTVEALHTSLWDSFKLQSVNKEFYTGVSNSFVELLQHLKNNGRDEESAKLFSSRLLGRLLFVWFLRKKNIIDESMGYFDAGSANATDYYHKSLERLFFNTLNIPVDERDEIKQESQKRLFPETDNEPQTNLFKTDQKTPYLNGGLFEPHENDWYRDSNLTLPDGFFINLYDHFNQFNFTTDESTPEYEQVAIDPEMLGQVFESLLATQVDETGQQARKAKGAFYTPREIVSYMCKESLRNYLYGIVVDDDRYIKAIDDLLDRSDHDWAGAGTNSIRDAVPKEYRTSIVDALDNVTVLDPACGSGAFPMGMLQLLTKTYERLEGRFDPYKTKLQIVQNNIFGVDIEPMAVEISRLRAWLSLIVDEADMQTVAPLPNLDFKFVCANSLIPLDEVQGLYSDNELHQKLKDIRVKYFNARVLKSKKKLQSEYYKLADSRQQSFTDDLRTRQLKSFDPFKNLQPAEFFDTDHMFGLEEGFDLIIGNPPYVNVFQLTKNVDFNKSQYKELYETARGAYDLYILFFELGINLLSKEGVLAYITPNKYISAEYAHALRALLARRTSILDIVDVSKASVFDAAVYPIVTVIQLGSQNRPLKLGVGIRHADNSILIDTFVKNIIKQDGADKVDWSSLLNQDLGWIAKFDKLPKLTKFANVSASFTVSDSYNIIQDVYEFEPGISQYKKLIVSSNIEKYFASWGEKTISYLKHRFTRPIIKNISTLPITEARKIKLESEKLIIAGMTKHLRVFYDEKCEYVPTIPTIIITEIKINPKYLLALLNSTLIDSYYRYKYDSLSLAGGYLRVGVPQISEMPVLLPNKDIEKKIEMAVNELILEGRENVESPNTMKLLELIDQLIYKLYGLNDNEIQLIEDSMK